MLGLLKKKKEEEQEEEQEQEEEEEEEEEEWQRAIFFTSRGAYVKLRYVAMLYTHSIENQP